MYETAVPPPNGSYPIPSLEHGSVAAAMHRGIVACEPDATLTQVARVMATHHIHCLAVIGVSHQGPECGVWGILSDLDLIRAGVGPDGNVRAGSLAQQPLVSITPDSSLRHATELMLTHGVSHLVVIEPESQRPVGILSSLDVVRLLASGED